jgi:hypothetical protein
LSDCTSRPFVGRKVLLNCRRAATGFDPDRAAIAHLFEVQQRTIGIGNAARNRKTGKLDFT